VRSNGCSVQAPLLEGAPGASPVPAPLKGVPETLLIALYARHLESQRDDAIVRDPEAGEILQRLGLDVSKFSKMSSAQLGVAVRTEVIDEAVCAYLDRRSHAVIVNLGAGLCTRFSRVDDGCLRWIDVDLPEVEPFWRRAFEGTARRELIVGSILESAWLERLDGVDPGRLLFVAEGVLIYFSHDEATSLLARLAERFPGAEVVFDTVGPVVARTSALHAAVSRTGARYRWGITSLERLEEGNSRLRLEESVQYLERHQDRWGPGGAIGRLGRFKRELQVARVRFLDPPGEVR
jgi:O-methyltransferase involved in polyketide biosynthesis